MASFRVPARGILKKIALKDGRIAAVSFLSQKDGAKELNDFINSLVSENAKIIYDRRVTLEEEKGWKKAKLSEFNKGESFILVARVGGKIAGTSEARKGRFKEDENVSLGLAIAKPYRGIGLGEALLRANVENARKAWRPRNMFLSVLANNRPAKSLYRKVGFRKFASFPKWVRHKGKFVDHEWMKL
ncbi:MAG TPA: GNAT family N-acetyltransferase [Candidatus Bilamarchaeum sp.]|nr:GNAT family N-acetyltransferase [Candidatus Bilamarchaeum sp.]